MESFVEFDLLFGWNNYHAYVDRNRARDDQPERQGCWWTKQEDRDLLAEVHQGFPVTRIAAFHMRSENAITMRIERLINAATSALEGH